MMIEERGVGASLDINNVKIRRANTTRCHYTGRARGSDYSEPGDKHRLHQEFNPLTDSNQIWCSDYSEPINSLTP
jgi:hypothetical protein